MFFLELGEGKKQKIDKDYDDLKTGVQYSMNTLKKLQKVFLADKFIEKEALELEEFEISKNSNEFIKINPEYKECNIKVTFGYYKDYKLSEKIKNSPNFYKYFPMGDETNGFNFIIHCDSFSNEANRRKLQQDDINKNLFPEISKLIINKINDYKISNREQFLCLYASLLLSDIPTKQNNEWLKPIFYDNLLSYLQKNIPTKNNKFSDNAQNVKINKLDLDFAINLADFGLEHIQWFEWERGKDAELVNEAKEKTKLGLATWGVENLLIHANLDKLNAWLANADEKTYKSFLQKINTYNLQGTEIKKRLLETKLFKFNNGVFYSFNEIKNFSNVFFTTPKIVNRRFNFEMQFYFWLNFVLGCQILMFFLVYY